MGCSVFRIPGGDFLFFSILVLAMAVRTTAAAGVDDSIAGANRGLEFGTDTSLFRSGGSARFGGDGLSRSRPAAGSYRVGGAIPSALADTTWNPGTDDAELRTAAAESKPTHPDVLWPVEHPEDAGDQAPEITNDRIFFKGWLLITSVEVVLLAVTATLPKDWTGWSSQFVKDGWGNLQDAYSYPPVWDTDHWFHNYIGHPYGGSVYYNTVRCQGARKGQSFLFATALSIQWEYLFEAVAEQPSIQDLFITPIAGSVLGEFVHRLTLTLKKNGTNFGEKVLITILNPTSVVFNGYD